MSGFGVAPATYISSAGWNTSVQYSRLKSIYVNIANKNDTLSHGIERCLHTSCTSSQSVSARQGVFFESSVQFLINMPSTLYPCCKQQFIRKNEPSAEVERLPYWSRLLPTWRRRLGVRKANQRKTCIVKPWIMIDVWRGGIRSPNSLLESKRLSKWVLAREAPYKSNYIAHVNCAAHELRESNFGDRRLSKFTLHFTIFKAENYSKNVTQAQMSLFIPYERASQKFGHITTGHSFAIVRQRQGYKSEHREDSSLGDTYF